MENENLKVFKVTGEYKMSEDDNFKTAKNISLDSALKILDGEVKNFLRDNFKNLDDDDIPKIAEKFLKKNEPRFVRENLPDNEMICYAYIDAEINLDDLNNFMKNFDVFKLEKKVDEMQKIIDELNSKFKLYQKFLPQLFEAEMNLKKYPSVMEYINRGVAYANLKNYEQAISDYNEAILLNPSLATAYKNRGFVYEEMGEIEKAEKDFAKARELGFEY